MKRVISLSLFFCLSAGWAVADKHAYPRTVLEDRPVGYWRFEKARTGTRAENLGSQETALDGTCVDMAFTPVSQITGTPIMQPGTLELETAYYTISQFRDLRLRREPAWDW